MDRDPNPTELIAAIAAKRDPDAFAQLFDLFAPRAKTFMVRLGCDNVAAEEFAQEVMLNVWRHAAGFDPKRASVATWIFTIVRNLRIDSLRRDRRNLIDPAEHALFLPEQQGAEADLSATERWNQIARAVADLPPEQSKIVELAYIEGKSHREIAEELRLPLGTVKSRMRLAIGRVRQALREEP